MTVKKKLKHLIKKFNFKKDELNEIEKMYNLDYFDPNDQAYLRLLDISKDLCIKYSTAYQDLGSKPSIFKIIKVFFKRKKILSLLFPGHKTFASVGENLDAVIGLVDFTGCAFMNREVKFSKYALVQCDNFSIFGPKIQVGDDYVERKGNLIKLSKIHLKHDCWICSGVKINNNVVIESECVLAAGALVDKNTDSKKVIAGRPAKEIKTITKDMKSNKISPYKHSKEEIDILISHLHKLGFRGSLKQYKKALSGEKFNGCNITLGRIYLYSHRLSSEYNSIYTSKERKEEILDILFPIRGENFKIGENIFVDLIGSTIIGDNVTIGNDIFLAGNVILKDNCVIDDGASLFASGHELYAKGRRTGFSLKYGLYEFSKSEAIIIKENVHVGKDVIIVPGSVVSNDVSDNRLVVGEKII